MSDDPSGYGKPPRARQFGQPGGNRRGPGRGKGSKNVATIFATAAGGMVAAKDGSGGTRKMSKLEAAMTQLANKAASGELRAINMFLAMAQAVEARAEHDKPADVVLTEADRKVIGLLRERIKQQLESERDE